MERQHAKTWLEAVIDEDKGHPSTFSADDLPMNTRDSDEQLEIYCHAIEAEARRDGIELYGTFEYLKRLRDEAKTR